jgi:hypothetical protein
VAVLEVTDEGLFLLILPEREDVVHTRNVSWRQFVDCQMPKPAKRTRKDAKPEAEPRLGIFWLVDGKLLTESLPLSECEDDGDFRNYPASHIDVWTEWQRTGKAPSPSEYEEFPRGRVIHNDDGFTIRADRCILKRKDLIARIKREFHLPRQSTQTSLGTDPHYRCFHCLYDNVDAED